MERNHNPELILQLRQQKLKMMDSEHSSIPGGNTMNSKEADTKVLSDLKTLSDQIDLCVEMVKEQNGKIDSTNDALLGVIGFLEACVPRMVELVEAAAQGILLESTLETCLSVNDRLLKVLSDCEGNADSKPSYAQPAAAAAAAKPSTDVDLDDLLLDDSVVSPSNYKPSSKIGAGKYQQHTGPVKSDPFGGHTDLLTPTKAPPSVPPPPVPPAQDNAISLDDEFDAFLEGRASSDKKD